MSILNKHMKIYSISLVTKEMQFKVVYELKVKKKIKETTARYPYTGTGVAKIRVAKCS